MKRMLVSPEEEEVLLGLRHEKEIWNKALEAALLEFGLLFKARASDSTALDQEEVEHLQLCITGLWRD